MDFLDELFDFGDRKRRKKDQSFQKEHYHDDDDDDDNDDNDDDDHHHQHQHQYPDQLIYPDPDQHCSISTWRRLSKLLYTDCSRSQILPYLWSCYPGYY